MDSYLTTATRLLAETQIQLEAEGFPPTLVARGLERAQSSAQAKARPISPAIYGQAFLDLLVDELKGVREWMQRVRSASRRG